MQSISQKDFARIPSPQIQRSSFDRSSGLKTTFDASVLVPVFYDEALPGDSFKLNASFFARLNTPIVPILDNMYFETFFFEIPMRQLWENWERFNGAQDNPNDSTDFLIPQIVSPAGGYAQGSIYDYFGIPVGVEGLSHSALPLRAYNHVYNNWFRDQNLIDSIVMPTDDGPDLDTNYVLKKRGKRHDYFTSALPWPQKSDSGSVEILLGTSANVRWGAASDPSFEDQNATMATNTGDQARFFAGSTFGNTDLGVMTPDESAGLYADLSEATAATINQLRQSIAVQRLFEKDARGGTRYIEVIKSHFGVTSPDLRLQRPGYLGGGRTQVNISPIAQTTPTGIVPDVTPQGNLSGIGTVGASGHGFTKSFTEHTIIIGLAMVRADLTYQRGLERSWSRQTRFDFYWPELATIGEQEVLQKEIFASGVEAEDELVFGYQERFAEYRYKPSLITGKMRSIDPESLDVWHLSQDFADAPVLSEAFIEENVPLDRCIAVADEPHFKMDAYFSLQCARPLPMYGIPGLDKL